MHPNKLLFVIETTVIKTGNYKYSKNLHEVLVIQKRLQYTEERSYINLQKKN